MTTKPKRRVCDHDCPEWLGPGEYALGNCGLCLAHETRAGEPCRVGARFLRRHPLSWAKDELEARGLKRPMRRVCGNDCPHWRHWQDRGDPGICAIGEPPSYTVPGDLCDASEEALRERITLDPSGWEADELRARGLRV